MRVKQKLGTRGSLRAIQAAVERPEVLNVAIRHVVRILRDASIEWRSPLATDEWAEYRDGDFLRRVGLDHLSPRLAKYWPTRGPQWDALARVSTGEVLLVEAKSHVRELLSSCKAGPRSLTMIEAALEEAKDFFGAREDAGWTRPYYQLANRLAHLSFLRRNGVNAHLLLLCFMNDDMGGPDTPAEWRSALDVARRALGLEGRALPGVHELFVDVRTLRPVSRA